MFVRDVLPVTLIATTDELPLIVVLPVTVDTDAMLILAGTRCSVLPAIDVLVIVALPVTLTAVTEVLPLIDVLPVTVVTELAANSVVLTVNVLPLMVALATVPLPVMERTVWLELAFKVVLPVLVRVDPVIATFEAMFRSPPEMFVFELEI